MKDSQSNMNTQVSINILFLFSSLRSTSSVVGISFDSLQEVDFDWLLTFQCQLQSLSRIHILASNFIFACACRFLETQQDIFS